MRQKKRKCSAQGWIKPWSRAKKINRTLISPNLETMKITPRQRILLALIVVAAAVLGAVIYLNTVQPRLETQLTIYGPRGIGDLGIAAAETFSKKFGVNATFQHFGMGSIEIANKILEEVRSGAQAADIIYGFPEFYAKPLLDAGVLLEYVPPNINEIARDKIWDLTRRITPLDEGYIVVMYNQSVLSQRGLAPPEALDDLLRPEYKGLVVYNNPTTSGTGLSVLTWVLTEKGERDGFDFLQKLKQNIARPGYPTGFSALVRALRSGEVAVTVSFTSHTVDPQTPSMKSMMAKGFVYREGVAIVKGAKNLEAAKKFIEFMLSKEGQDLVDPKNFMYPVRGDSVLVNMKNAQIPRSLVYHKSELGGKADAWREKWRTEVFGA